MYFDRRSGMKNGIGPDLNDYAKGCCFGCSLSILTVEGYAPCIDCYGIGSGTDCALTMPGLAAPAFVDIVDDAAVLAWLSLDLGYTLAAAWL